LIERSFQGLSVAAKTMRINEELMEIWLNEVCDKPFLYPQNVTLYDEYIEQVIINLELVLRPQEAIKMNWHQVTKRVTEGLCSGFTFG